VLTEQELEQKPDNIEGLEGLDETWCAGLSKERAAFALTFNRAHREIDFDDLEFGSELARGNFGASVALHRALAQTDRPS
jgi:hypothetical protein